MRKYFSKENMDSDDNRLNISLFCCAKTFRNESGINFALKSMTFHNQLIHN